MQGSAAARALEPDLPIRLGRTRLSHGVLNLLSGIKRDGNAADSQGEMADIRRIAFSFSEKTIGSKGDYCQTPESSYPLKVEKRP